MCSKKTFRLWKRNRSLLAVTPWGDLYPCHQFVGEEKFLLGNVFDGIKRTDICDEFRSCNVYTKRKNVKTVLRDSTVAAAVLQTLIISMEQLMILMI